MATSQAAPATTAAVIGSSSGTASTTSQTIVGSHLLKIDGFSATKDLGVGKSIKSSTFRVGGHGWYIECYPCGEDEKSAGRVTLYLCLSDHKAEQVEAECLFTPMDEDVEAQVDFQDSYSDKHTYNAETSWRWGCDLIERATLESLLKDDCFRIRCDVYTVKGFSAVPPPDLTFQVGGEFITVHRCIPYTRCMPDPSSVLICEVFVHGFD